jgi:lipoate-protein ligase A
MAVDEALLESAIEPGADATLRLYHFRRPTVTFGYGQALDRAVDVAACRARNIARVRRITGGRALLHHHELTFSVTGPPLAGTVRATYGAVAGAFRHALERLRIPVDPASTVASTRAAERLPCLAVPTGHEITAGGKKLVASAMRFRRRGFLVHGSILWAVDHELWRRVTRLEASDPLPAVGLRELGGAAIGEPALVDALSSAMAEVVSSPRAPGSLTARERERAAALCQKYRSRAWTDDRATSPSRLVDNSEAVW